MPFRLPVNPWAGAWFASRAAVQASATGPTCPSLSGLVTVRIVWIRPSSMSSEVLRTLPSRSRHQPPPQDPGPARHEHPHNHHRPGSESVSET